MHICIVSNEFPPHPHGGIGSLYQDLAEQLVAAGHRVTVVGIYAESTLDPDLLHKGVQMEVRKGVRILRATQTPRFLRYRAGAMADRMRLKMLLHACHREDPFDLVEAADYGGWLCFGGIAGIPSIVRIHGSNIFFDTTLGRDGVHFEHQLEIRTLAKATHIGAVSEFSARTTLEICGLSQRACEVVPNAVDVDLFAPQPGQTTVPGRVLFVNSINQKKGVEELICSLPFIVQKHPDAHLVLVGRDTSRPVNGKTYSEHLLERLRPALRERITFTGALDRRTGVLAELRKAQVCCYPSHMETFGIAAVEAMALGKPTVFSETGPGPEVVHHGEDGLLCNPRDPEDIAEKICHFLQDREYAEKVGRQAREKVLREFNHHFWLQRNVEFYERCIADSRSSRKVKHSGGQNQAQTVRQRKLHIALVCHEFPPAPHGGIGSSVYDMATGLAGQGHRVTVVGTYSAAQLKLLQDTGPPPGVELRLLEERVTRMGTRPRLVLERVRLRKHIQAIHAQHPIDLVEYLDYGGWLAFGSIRGLCQIVRLQGSNALFDKELGRKGENLEHWMEVKSLHQADHWVGVSQYALDKTTLLAAPALRPASVIHNCVDPDVFCPDPSVPVEEGRILFVNSISVRKGVVELFQAMNTVFAQVPGSTLALIGEITYRGEAAVKFKEMLLASLAPEYHSRVLWLGRLERGTGVLNHIRRAQVCCYPSHAETFGIAPAEAMSVGKPVVFTKLGPGPEVVEHGESGLLADPKDPADLAAQLLLLLQDKELAARLAVAGRERVIQRFSKGAWITKNVDLYYNCVERHGTK